MQKSPGSQIFRLRPEGWFGELGLTNIGFHNFFEMSSTADVSQATCLSFLLSQNDMGVHHLGHQSMFN